MRGSMKEWVGRLALTAALTIPSLAVAQQQEPPTNVDIEHRPRPDYDPLGVRVRSFFVNPSLTVGTGYDDNVFATNNNREDDVFFTVAPEVNVKSNWSRHQLQLGVGGEAAWFADQDEQNYQDVFGNLSGRLDISRANKLDVLLSAARKHEDSSSPDAEDNENNDVSKFYEYRTGLNYRHDFARLFAIVGADIDRLDFQDHDGINEDDRDRNQYRGRLRGGIDLTPRINVFAEGTVDTRQYDQTPNDGGVDRESNGYVGRLGVGLDLTNLIFGEFTVGYTERHYKDGDLGNVGGLNGGGTITWNVTPLTSLILSAQADVIETTVDFNGDTANADRRAESNVEVWHELLRNVLLHANAGYVRDDFDGVSRTDDTVIAGGGLRYLLNRNLYLDATYNFDKRWSDDNDEEYYRNVVRLALTAQL